VYWQATNEDITKDMAKEKKPTTNTTRCHASYRILIKDNCIAKKNGEEENNNNNKKTTR